MLFRRKTLLIGAFVCISLAFFQSEAPAQVKADKGKSESKDQLKFEIYQDSAKDYRWRLVRREGNDREVLATGGQGYKAKADCKHGVEVLQKGADKLNFETYEDKAKESRWRAKSSNGQTVAASGSSYKSKAECDKAVETIKKGAAKSPVEEVTEPKS